MPQHYDEAFRDQESPWAAVYGRGDTTGASPRPSPAPQQPTAAESPWRGLYGDRPPTPEPEPDPERASLLSRAIEGVRSIPGRVRDAITVEPPSQADIDRFVAEREGLVPLPRGAGITDLGMGAATSSPRARPRARPGGSRGRKTRFGELLQEQPASAQRQELDEPPAPRLNAEIDLERLARARHVEPEARPEGGEEPESRLGAALRRLVPREAGRFIAGVGGVGEAIDTKVERATPAAERLRRTAGIADRDRQNRLEQMGTRIAEAFPPVHEGPAFDPSDPIWWVEGVGQGAIQIGAQAALALTTGGASTAGRVAAFALPNLVLEGGSQRRQVFELAREAGASEEEAQEAAATATLTSGAVASALEAVPGAALFMKRVPGADRLFARLFSERMAQLAASRAGRAGATAIAEGGTEAAQEAASALTAFYTSGNPRALDELGGRILAGGTIGTVVGAAAGTVRGAGGPDAEPGASPEETTILDLQETAPAHWTALEELQEAHATGEIGPEQLMAAQARIFASALREEPVPDLSRATEPTPEPTQGAEQAPVEALERGRELEPVPEPVEAGEAPPAAGETEGSDVPAGPGVETTGPRIGRTRGEQRRAGYRETYEAYDDAKLAETYRSLLRGELRTGVDASVATLNRASVVTNTWGDKIAGQSDVGWKAVGRQTQQADRLRVVEQLLRQRGLDPETLGNPYEDVGMSDVSEPNKDLVGRGGSGLRSMSNEELQDQIRTTLEQIGRSRENAVLYERMAILDAEEARRGLEPQEFGGFAAIPLVPRGSTGGGEPSRSGPRPRARGLPPGTPHITLGRYRSVGLPLREDFEPAKAGDVEAAAQIVSDLVSEEQLEQAREQWGPEVIYLPVVAQEATGGNVLPRAMAARYAQATGGRMAEDVVQTNRAFHRGARMMERILGRAEFDGPIEEGGRYVLVDDVTTSGATFAELAEHVRRGGGEVVGVVTLATGSRAGEFSPDPEAVSQIEERLGDVIREELQIEPSALTADEVRYLNGFRTPELLRDRIATARRQRGERLLQEGVQPEGPEEGPGGPEGEVRGLIPPPGAEERIRAVQSGEVSPLVPDTDLFGQPVEPEGPAQGELLEEGGGPQGISAAVAEARAIVTAFQGRVQRGAASAAELELYNRARTVLRAQEGRGLDEEEVRARREEGASPRDEGTGDLFGLVPDRTELTPLEQLRGEPGELRDVQEITPTIYRETSLGRLETLLPSGSTFEDMTMERVYSANTPNLALGQSGNRGVLVEMDSSGLKGRINTEKPAWEFAYSGGDAEVVLSHNPQSSYRDALRSVTIKPDAEASRVDRIRIHRALKRLEESGWSRTELSDGSVRYARPGPDTAPLFAINPVKFSQELLPEAGKFVQGTGEEAVSPVTVINDLTAAISKILATKTAQGGLNRRLQSMGALGQANIHTQVIRLQDISDLESFGHELGHLMQKTLYPGAELADALPGAARGELEDMARGISDESLEEGFAEFWRRYLNNPEALERRAPNALELIEARMDEVDPRIRTAWLEGREQALLNQQASPEARVGSKISVGQRGETLSIRHRISRLRTDVLDVYEPLRQVTQHVRERAGIDEIGEDAETLARLHGGATGVAETMLGVLPGRLSRTLRTIVGEGGRWVGGMLDWNTGRVVGPSLGEILEPVQTNLDAFRRYIVARRAVELHEREILTGFRDQDVREVVETSEERFGETFTRAFEQLQEYNDGLLSMLRDSGIISQQTFESIQELNQNYVPFYRVVEGQDAGGLSGTFGHLFSPVRRIRGGGQDVIDPLESIIKNTYTYADIAARQQVSEALARMARKEGVGDQLERLVRPIRREQFTLEEIEGRLEEIMPGTSEMLADMREAAEEDWAEMTAGMDPSEIREAQKAGTLPPGPADPGAELLAVFRPGDYFGKPNVISVLRGGRRQWYEVDPELYAALEGMGREHLGWITKLGAIPARLLRAGATLAPEFQIRNPLRDQVMAFVQSEYGYVPGFDLARGIFELIRKGEAYEQWKAHGGERAALLALDRKTMQQHVRTLTRTRGVKDVLLTPLDALRAFSALMEDGTRMGEFLRARRAEGTTKEGLQRAAAASREVSIDFHRHGAKTTALRLVTAFWNARLQGYDRLARAFKRDPVGASIRAFAAITVPSILEYLVNRDEPEYWEIPQWQRDLFWVFRIRDTWVRVPKPFELGLVFGTLPVRLLESFVASNPGAGEELNTFFTETLGREALSIGPDPTFMMPLVENLTNYSFFLRRRLDPQSELQVQPRFRGGPGTSEAAKIIARWVDATDDEGVRGRVFGSPRDIDNLLFSWTGGLGRIGADVVSAPLRPEERGERPSPTPADIPGIRGLVARKPGFGSESVDRFYDFYTRATAAARTESFLEREGRMDEWREFRADAENQRLISLESMLRDVASEISSLRSQAEQVERHPTMGADQKRERLERLGEQAMSRAQQALAEARRRTSR